LPGELTLCPHVYKKESGQDPRSTLLQCLPRHSRIRTLVVTGRIPVFFARLFPECGCTDNAFDYQEPGHEIEELPPTQTVFRDHSRSDERANRSPEPVASMH